MLRNALFKGAEDGVHHRGVERMRGKQAPAGDGLLGEALFERGDLRGRAGDHAHARIVDGGQRERAVEMKFAGGKRNGKHRSGGKIVDQAPARRDDVQRIFKGEDAGEAGGDVFADAVAHHGCRLDAKRHPPTRQSVLDGEKRGLCEPGLIQFFGCGVFVPSGG